MSFFFFRNLLNAKGTQIYHVSHITTTAAALCGGGVATMASSASHIGGGAFANLNFHQWNSSYNYGNFFDWTTNKTF
jgi:hypothetical protein